MSEFHTTPSAPTALWAGPAPEPARAVSASFTFAWGALLKIKRVPEQLGDVTVYSGVTLNRDLSTGAFDRFRSLPVWRPAPILGAMIGDVGRYPLTPVIVLALGFAMGYRRPTP